MKRNRFFWSLAGILLLAAPSWAGSYTDNGNGTITDDTTGLIWQQQDDGGERTWEVAITYCEGLSLANLTDWRLPNVKELESITDDTLWAPAIVPIFTDTKTSGNYWTSTTYANFSLYAWNVTFNDGSVNGYDAKSGNNYVRCVRGGQ